MEPERLLVGLGLAIRELRGQRSQEELALETGIHRNYIGGIERAERQPTVTSVARLAEVLGVTPAQLLAKAEELAPR